MAAVGVSDVPVVVHVVRAAAGQLEVVVELTAGTTRAPVASWAAADTADRPPVVAAVRSPDRTSAAVLVGSTLSRVDLETGTRSIIDAAVSWPTDGEVEVAWNAGVPCVVAIGTDGPCRLPLGDGRVLVLDASLWSDDGFSGGDQGSMAGVAMPWGTSREDVERARDELHASLDDEALVERREWARVEGAGAPAVLFENDASGAYGTTNVHWPVTVGRTGTLVRASTTRFSGGGADDTQIDRPWFVRNDGRVERPDVRLGNAPVCELPDGRWLLPGADALWCDAGNEPLHAVGLDGRLTPWNPDASVSTSGLLRSVAPGLLPPTPPEHLDDWPWLTAARVSADGADIVLLIAERPWLPFWDPDVEVAWALVGLSSDGRGTPTLVAEGRRTAREFCATAL